MKTYKKRLIAVLLAVLVMACGVVPAFAAQPKSTQGRKVVSQIVEKSFKYGLWEAGFDTDVESSEINYTWDLPHHNVNIINPVTKDSRYWEAIGFVGLIDQQNFISNDVFLAQLAVTDPLGMSPLLDKSLALIFCYSDMIRNGEIKHINKNEFNFYAVNGKLIRYTRKDEESGKRFSTNYKYNKQGNLSSIRGEEGNYTFQYDKNGKLVSFISEEADDGAPFELVFKIKRDEDGRIASVNDCPYSYYDNGMLRKLDTYNGTLQNGISQNRGEIVSFYYNDDNSANAAFLHYTTI